eukprot:jgi/Ulvmu1/9705/UM055_0043.1
MHLQCLAKTRLGRCSSLQVKDRVRPIATTTPNVRSSAQPDNARPLETSTAGQVGALVAAPGGHDVLAPASSRPLHNRRVIVTGPRQYASKLTGLLLDAGARPLWVPCVEISALEDPGQVSALQQALRNLPAFTHVAFTSKNGINAVLQELDRIYRASARTIVEDSGVRLCALGADAQALEAAGYPVHVLPQEASTQGLVRELAARGELEGARVLCPVPFVTGGLVEPPVVPRFLAALEEGGASATRVPAYMTRAGVTADDIAPEAALMSGGCVDAVVFTSTAEAQGLLSALGGVEDLQALVLDQGIVLAAHGPYTAAGVAAATDLSVDVIGSAFGSFHGVVAALEAHFTPPADEPDPGLRPPVATPSAAPPPPAPVQTPPVQAAQPQPGLPGQPGGGSAAQHAQCAQQLSGLDHLQSAPAQRVEGTIAQQAEQRTGVNQLRPPQSADDVVVQRAQQSQRLSGMDHLQLLTPP